MLKLVSNKNIRSRFTPADYRFSLNRYSGKIKKTIGKKVLCIDDIEKIYQQLVIEAFRYFPKHSIASFEYYWFVAISELTINRYYGESDSYAYSGRKLINQ